MKNLLLFIIGISGFLGNRLNAQMGSFLFESDRQTTIDIPFEMVSNLIVIKLSVNGSDSLNFILDTGVRRTILLDTSILDRNSLRYTIPIMLRGFGQDYELQAYLSTGNQIDMPGIKGRNQWICVLRQGKNEFSQRMGKKIHGIIGCDLFSQFVIEIQYDKKLIKFRKPCERTARRVRSYHFIPFKIEDEKPVVELTLNQTDSTSKKIRALVDTGLSDAIWAFTFADSTIVIPEKNFKTILGGGLNGDIVGNAGRVPKIVISDFMLEDVMAAFPDSNAIGTASMMGRQASIGNELLRRFDVVFDYQNTRIGLKKGRGFRQPFKYNRSGIDLVAKMPGLPIYEVSEIRKNSPADRAQLQIGDMIIKVQGEECLDKRLDEVYDLLNPEKAKKVKLQVMRNGLSQKIVLDAGDELD